MKCPKCNKLQFCFSSNSCYDVAVIVVVVVYRDQDLAEALDSGGSDMEMERGMVQIQEDSAQHRAKMWKVCFI